MGLDGLPRRGGGTLGGRRSRILARIAVSAAPLLQCGGGALRASLGSVGPVWAWFALLLHPVGYCLLAVEAVPSRVPMCRCPSLGSFYSVF